MIWSTWIEQKPANRCIYISFAVTRQFVAAELEAASSMEMKLRE
jgi:hypothetical protein